MKERAIVIFEKRKKKKGQRCGKHTDGRDDGEVTPFPFQSPTARLITHISNEKNREKRVSIIGIIF